MRPAAWPSPACWTTANTPATRPSSSPGLGYAGADNYVDEQAVIDGDLVTASSVAPVEFARAILERLDVYEPAVLESWFKLFGKKDPAGFYELMAAS